MEEDVDVFKMSRRVTISTKPNQRYWQTKGGQTYEVLGIINVYNRATNSSSIKAQVQNLRTGTSLVFREKDFKNRGLQQLSRKESLDFYFREYGSPISPELSDNFDAEIRSDDTGERGK